MRIIAGMAKGRNLFSPIGATRPTSDRAREALFSSLESEFGSMSDLNFLDLYCGSGAVGAEALSRGAAVVYAIDNDDKATTVARQNLELLQNISGVGTYNVVTSSVGKFLEKGADLTFDVVFVDPPYDLPNNEIEKTMEALLRNGFLKPSSVIAIERDAKSRPLNWPAGLQEVKQRKYGAAMIIYAEPSA
jgi:16S rRNA (guanine966-N2)-methyltransferase